MTSIQTTIKISDANMGDTITWKERGRPQKAHVQHTVHNERLTYVYVQGTALAIEFDSEFEVTARREIIAEPQEFGDLVNILNPWCETKAVRTANRAHPWACSNGSEYTWAGLHKLGTVIADEPEKITQEWATWQGVPEDTPVSDRAGSVRKKLCGEILFRAGDEWQPSIVLPCELNEYAPFTEATK